MVAITTFCLIGDKAMQVEQFRARAKRAKEVRSNRNDRHIIFQLDTSEVTYDTKQLASQLGFPSARKLRDYLKKIESEGTYAFNRQANNHYALNPTDVLWLCKELQIETYRDTNNGKRAFVINVQNLKGGVGKSLSCCTIADGLTQDLSHITKQLRVLIIDLDPQGSATKQLLGNFSQAEAFTSAITLMSMHKDDVTRELIQELSIEKTRNSKLDIIPCTTEDGFLAEHLGDIANDHDIKVYDMLRTNVIEPIQYDYDIIILDAGPHLDNVTRATLGASDGTLMPVPPKEFDFDSSVKFIERLPTIYDELIEDGYNLEALQFSKAYLNLWIDNSRSVIGTTYNAFAVEELGEIFGEHDLLSHNLPYEPAYQKCSDVQQTIFSINPSVYKKEMGDPASFDRAKAAAAAWLEAIWKSIKFAHKNIEG
jgi:cellulose biosynthesis protein BcsQ